MHDICIRMHCVRVHDFMSDAVITGSCVDGLLVCSRLDMLRCLSRLSGVWIRGGFYAGHEDTYIMDVKLMAGESLFMTK
jgi:hypothetical protein